MLGSNGLGNSTLSTRMRLVYRLGTLCGVFAMVSLNMGGCIFPPPVTTCTVDADCDDSDGCTTDVCDVATGVCGNTADCDAEHCLTVSNAENTTTVCVECINSDVDCDDADVCNGLETCDTGNCVAGTPLDCDDANACTDDACDAVAGCSNTAVECLANETCVDGECLVVCDEDADCDDGVFCTGAEACVDGVCANGDAPCPDNGDFCDGTESCDAATDACESSGDPCEADGLLCNEDTDACDEGVACTTDADCADDDLFCTGTESCDTATGFCTASGDPCDTAAGETCNEDLNTCDEEQGPQTLFTLSLDTLTGTAAADTFVGNLAFNATTATNVPTVQTGDSANGGDGTDTMTALFSFTAVTTVAPTLTSIETLTVTDFGTAATTLQGTSITGLTTLNTLNSSNTNVFTVNNLASVPDVGITNNTAGLSLSFVTAATSGATDDMTVNLSNVTAGTLTLTSATTNGLETVTVNSTGAANTLAAITQTTGTTLATVNATGDTLLTVTAALPTSVATVGASTNTGGVVLNVTGNTGNVTVTGGTGNDTFTLGANYTSGDTVNGGTGTDTLGLTSATAAAAATQSNVTGIEGLTVTDGLAANVTASRFGSIATANLESSFTGAVTLTMPLTGATVNLGARTASNDGTANGTIDIPGLGTTDTLTFNINDSDTSSAYIFTGIETLTMTSNNRGDGNAADGAVNTIGGALTMTPTFGTGTITLTGAASLTLTGVLTSGTLNASAFTGSLVMSAATAATTIISSGSGNDTLFGSNAGDSLNAGTGVNTLEGLGGVDSITLGAGVDTVRIFVAAANGVDRKLVSGFTVGSGGDVLNIDGDGLNVLDGTDNFASASTIQAHSAAGNMTVAAASEIVRITSGTVTNLTDANSLNGTNLLVAVGGTITAQAIGNEHLFLIADVSGNTGVYYGDAGADTGIVAGELTLVAVLQTTTLGNFVFSNFSNAN